MDEHRNLEPRGRFPDGIELGVVELEAGAVGLLGVQPEALLDLADAGGAGLDVGLELRRDLLPGSRRHVAQVEPGEDHEPILVLARGDRGELRGRAGRPSCRWRSPSPCRLSGVHRRADLLIAILGGQRRRVAVEIDRRELGRAAPGAPARPASSAACTPGCWAAETPGRALRRGEAGSVRAATAARRRTRLRVRESRTSPGRVVS